MRQSSVTVKLNGVDGGGDGPPAVASPLLFCLFMAERLAFRELEHIVSFLAPVPHGSPLKWQIRQMKMLCESELMVTLSNLGVQRCCNNVRSS